VPAQQRSRLEQQPAPGWAWQQPRESSQDRSVGPVERWPGHLAPQHRDFVAQYQQLGILRGRASRQQREPPHHLAEHQVEQPQDHLPIIATR
jgi:hypothetical protein